MNTATANAAHNTQRPANLSGVNKLYRDKRFSQSTVSSCSSKRGSECGSNFTEFSFESTSAGNYYDVKVRDEYFSYIYLSMAVVHLEGLDNSKTVSAIEAFCEDNHMTTVLPYGPAKGD